MRKGSRAGSVTVQTTLEDEAFSAAPTPVSAPIQKTLDVYSVNLGQQIKIPSSRRSSSGAAVTSKISLIKPDTAEYLYLSNGYIFRGIEQTASAIIRNGYEIIASNTKDQEFCNTFRRVNRLDSKILNLSRNTALFGNGYWELYDSDDGPMIAELPSSEIDFLRDDSQNIIYNKNDLPKGYVQKRDEKVLAEWVNEHVVHFKFIEVGAADIGISMIQSTVFPCTEYGLIRGNLADAFIRSLNVVHVTVEGASAEDLADVADQLSKQFTAESVYVTSGRYKMDNVSNVGNNINPAEFIEPSVSEIAAAFSIPIELIASTSTFKLDDFPSRYAEWLETIKEKQRLIAETLETQVFDRLLKDPVTVKFNDPNPADVNTLFKNLGFAVQSKAITEEQSQNILEKLDVFPEV